MIRSFRSVATAMNAKQIQADVAAGNLASSNSPGFKKSRATIKVIFCFILGIVMVQASGFNCLFADDHLVVNSSIRISVNETSLVNQSQVLLGDVSEIQANGFLKEALEKISLGSSPKPGRIKSIQKKKIVAVIKGQKYLPKNISIVSPQLIYVKRLGQTILTQDIRQFVDEKLSQVFKNKEYQLTAFSVRGLESYPRGKTRFRLDSNDMVDKNGRLSFFLDVVIDGKKEDRVSVSGSVAVYEKVVHMKKSHARGVTISREDVCLEKKNIFDLSDDVIKKFEEIDKKVLKSSVKKGDVLKVSLLADPPLIRKGDIITLVSRNETLLIVTPGISKEDGFENKLIRVENLNSGKLVRGVVKGRSKVEVVN